MDTARREYFKARRRLENMLMGTALELDDNDIRCMFTWLDRYEKALSDIPKLRGATTAIKRTAENAMAGID